jgi:hypothetical protein
MKRDLKYWRFWLARLLINFAVNQIMPFGRCRTELNNLLCVWSLRVQAVIVADKVKQNQREEK